MSARRKTLVVAAKTLPTRASLVGRWRAFQVVNSAVASLLLKMNCSRAMRRLKSALMQLLQRTISRAEIGCVAFDAHNLLF
jgi:hypothetical protein